MKRSPPSSAPTRNLAAPQARHWSYPADSQATPEFPRPGAVLFEIGLVLGIHLAVALAVTLTLGALGIV